MNIDEIIYKRRSIRRYKQIPISNDILRKLVDYARVAPMAINTQYLEYIIINTQENREKLFPCLMWSKLLPPNERTPEKNRRPMAYIIICINKKIKNKATGDIGAAIENILLGALNFGLATCWLGSIDKEKIRSLFNIPQFYEISYVISIGMPDEESCIEQFNHSFKYWKENNTIHVPKRSLEDIIIKEI